MADAGAQGRYVAYSGPRFAPRTPPDPQHAQAHWLGVKLFVETSGQQIRHASLFLSSLDISNPHVARFLMDADDAATKAAAEAKAAVEAKAAADAASRAVAPTSAADSAAAGGGAGAGPDSTAASIAAASAAASATAATECVKVRFFERFASDLQKRADSVRDLLHSGKFTQRPGQTVAELHAEFKSHLLHVSDMAAADQMHFFRDALLPSLRTDCMCNHEGKPFTDLDALVQHAKGVEARNRARAAAQPPYRPRAHAAYAQDTDMPDVSHAMGPPNKKQKAGPSAGTAAARKGGRGAGRGGRHPAGRGPAAGTTAGGAGRGGGRGPGAGAGAQAPDNSSVCGIHDLKGDLITFARRLELMKQGICFNCFKPGHLRINCTAPPKPYKDGRMVQGKLVPYPDH